MGKLKIDHKNSKAQWLGNLEPRELFMRRYDVEERESTPLDIYMVLTRDSIYYCWERARTPSHIFVTNLSTGSIHCFDCHTPIVRVDGRITVWGPKS